MGCEPGPFTVAYTLQHAVRATAGRHSIGCFLYHCQQLGKLYNDNLNNNNDNNNRFIKTDVAPKDG